MQRRMDDGSAPPLHPNPLLASKPIGILALVTRSPFLIQGPIMSNCVMRVATTRLGSCSVRMFGARAGMILLFIMGMGGRAWGSDGVVVPAVFEWRPFLGPFHSLVLHYPIGFLTLAVILEIYGRFKPSPELRAIIRFVICLSFGSGLVAASLGWMRAATGGYEFQAVEAHRLFGLAVPTVMVATLVAERVMRRRQEAGLSVWVYRGFLGLSLALLIVTGHLGGNLTHGANFLVEHAPGFLKDIIHEVPSAGQSSGGLDSKAVLVQTIFRAKCVKCHGPEKHKGDYRLDLPAVAARGGKSGKTALVAGKPMESHLMERILLPRTSEDVMPPEGAPLTADEIVAIAHWIQAGAKFPTP